MDSLVFTSEDSRIIIASLDAFMDDMKKNCPPSAQRSFILSRMNSVRSRFALGGFGFTAGELRNVCIALESTLVNNPLDWKVSSLYERLKAYSGYVPEK